MRSWRDLWATSAALAAGIATHVVWDGFTHEGGWAVAPMGLSASWLRAGQLALPGYKLLQHLSSLAGMALLAVCAWRWLRARPVGHDAAFRFSAALLAALWVALLLGIPAACALRAWRLSVSQGAFSLHDFAYEFVTITLALDALLVITARPLLWRSRPTS